MKRCKHLYADWCHNLESLQEEHQELCGFYHHQEECPCFEELKK